MAKADMLIHNDNARFLSAANHIYGLVFAVSAGNRHGLPGAAGHIGHRWRRWLRRAQTAKLALELHTAKVILGSKEYGYPEWVNLACGEEFGFCPDRFDKVARLLLDQWNSDAPCAVTVLHDPPTWTLDEIESCAVAAFEYFAKELAKRTTFAVTLPADQKI